MLRKCFNKAATSYDLNAELQKSTGLKLLSLIKQHAFSYEKILDIGCGTGLITEEFATHLPHQLFHAVDIAEDLLIIAKNRLRHFNIHFFETHFDMIAHITTYDLIYANMSLHWSEHILLTIRKFLSLLHKKGALAFSIPLFGTFRELEPHVSIRQFIKKNVILDEFQVLHHEEEKITFEFPSMLHALQSIKKTGTNFVDKNFSGLRCNPFLKKLLLNPLSDSTTLTYLVGYFVLES